MDYDREQLVTDAFELAMEQVRAKKDASPKDIAAAVEHGIKRELDSTTKFIKADLERNRKEMERAVTERLKNSKELVHLNVKHASGDPAWRVTPNDSK